LADNRHPAVKRLPFWNKRLGATGLSILFNTGLRGSTLVLRFALSFYIVKFMGLEAAGIYGLALGVVTTAPAILGWGLNYFIARDVSGKSNGVTGAYMKSRLAVTIASLSLMTLLAVVAAFTLDYPVKPLYVVILIIVWLETISCDIHMPLISKEMASAANMLFFLRTTSWVLPVIALGLAFPTFRNIETVFVGWSLGYLGMFAGLFYFLRHWPLARIAKVPVRYDWIKSRMRRSWMIHISEICNVGLVYADRYIVSLLLTLSLTGVYTFYWSLANALQTLISTAVLQIAIPKLFKAYNDGSAEEWRRMMVRQFAKTAIAGLILGVTIFVAGRVVVEVMNMPALAEHEGVFALLLLTAAVRACTDLMGFGMSSLRKDGHYAVVNLSSVVISIGMSFLLISTLGFMGAGLAALVSALITASVSAFMLWRASRNI